MELPAAMEKSFRWRFHRSGISAASLIGRGTDLIPVWSGARVSFRGARMNADISKMVLSPSLRAVCKVPSGLRSAGFGRITATSRVPATLSSSTGMMKMGRTGYPTMWVLFKRSRMAVSTLSRVILAKSADKTAILSDITRFTGTVYRLINQPKRNQPLVITGGLVHSL